MLISLGRPMNSSEHPLVQQTYIVPTSAIGEMYGAIRRWIRRGVRGGIVYGHTRWGKTYAITYCSRLLKQESPRMVVLTVNAPREKTPSEASFLGDLLESAQHASPDSGVIRKKRSRLYKRYEELVIEASGKTLVLFVDEAQRLQIEHYEWLRNAQDHPGSRGIRMFVFLIGQPNILHNRTAYCADIDTSPIVSRFMIDTLSFPGLRTPSDLTMPLKAYDASTFPDGSDWTYTRFFLPSAFDAGFRLGTEAQVVWDSFEAAHRFARYDFPMEIPMEYVARSVEIALTENEKHDAPSFALSAACWAQAVAESNFVAALEALRIIFVDDAGTQ